MQNAEKYIDPIKWTYSEITTADERGEAFGCLDLVPFSEVHFYQSAEGLEVIVYQSEELSSEWGADIYNTEGETEVTGAAGTTPEACRNSKPSPRVSPVKATASITSKPSTFGPFTPSPQPTRYAGHLLASE